MIEYGIDCLRVAVESMEMEEEERGWIEKMKESICL